MLRFLSGSRGYRCPSRACLKCFVVLRCCLRLYDQSREAVRSPVDGLSTKTPISSAETSCLRVPVTGRADLTDARWEGAGAAAAAREKPKKKRRWKVAAIALAYRLHELGLLSDWLYHTTCVNLSRMRYRSGEPDGIEREASRLLGQVMSDLWTISHGFEELRRQLAVQPHDINDLVFNLAPVVLEGDRQQSGPLHPKLRVLEGARHPYGATPSADLRSLRGQSRWQLALRRTPPHCGHGSPRGGRPRVRPFCKQVESGQVCN